MWQLEAFPQTKRVQRYSWSADLTASQVPRFVDQPRFVGVDMHTMHAVSDVPQAHSLSMSWEMAALTLVMEENLSSAEYPCLKRIISKAYWLKNQQGHFLTLSKLNPGMICEDREVQRKNHSVKMTFCGTLAYSLLDEARGGAGVTSWRARAPDRRVHW